jgi:hypothetical protein
MPELPCVLWEDKIQTYRKDNNPYGCAGKELAHRLTWMAFYGPIPDGLVVMHTCDIRLCVQIDHLVLGTQGENLADMDRKGRRVNAQPGKGHKKPETHGPLQRIAQFTTRMRECNCGLRTNAGTMARHINARGGDHAIIEAR